MSRRILKNKNFIASVAHPLLVSSIIIINTVIPRLTSDPANEDF